ncbi:MAG: response regulator [Deltaproteobacteria bacterium]|nr:MAG: response regulator [Deltaproteobacteria bacterium]
MQARVLYIAGRKTREDDLLEILEALKNFGVEARVARDLRETWSAFSPEEFDLALIDIDDFSPGGYGSFSGIDEIISEVPSLLLSESGSLERWTRALEAGAIGFLTRPLDAETVTRFILKLVRKTKK